MKKNAFYTLMILSSSLVFAEYAPPSSASAPELVITPQESWMTDLLHEKDTSEWITGYVLCIDPKISDHDASIFFRRFIADPSTRADSIRRAVEYLAAVGYRNPETAAAIDAKAIYKAIYFANTFTIMDGLPCGPDRTQEEQIERSNQNQPEEVTEP